MWELLFLQGLLCRVLKGGVSICLVISRAKVVVTFGETEIPLGMLLYALGGYWGYF